MSDSTREALAEISQRARGIVEELARHTRANRGEAPGADANRPAGGQAWRRGTDGDRSAEQAPTPELHQRLSELRACVGEVADVLEATVERLETVELQLGDPDAGIEKQLGDGIGRCERVLMGIEHRILARDRHDASTRIESAAERRNELTSVLVLAQSSRRRADLCLALERQGLRAFAASDLPMAVRVAARTMPAVALVDTARRHGEDATWLHDWKDHEEQGTLPSAVLLDFVGTAAQGFEIIKEGHGEAAMAASLTRIARDGANGKAGEFK